MSEQISKHHEPDYGTGKKNLKVYLVGFVLCVILTLIPFHMVDHALPSIESGTLSHGTKAFLFLVMFSCAIVQFLVQVACFLRLTSKTSQGVTNILSFVFSIVVLVVIVGGSVWIMANLNYNMMPHMLRH